MSAETTGNQPKGCLPNIFYVIGRWLTEEPISAAPPETTGWHFRPGEEVDLGSVGTIQIPPAYERRFEGGTITVAKNSVGWSGDEIDVNEDGIIIRSEWQMDIEAQPDAETKELLRNLLERIN